MGLERFIGVLGVEDAVCSEHFYFYRLFKVDLELEKLLFENIGPLDMSSFWVYATSKFNHFLVLC